MENVKDAHAALKAVIAGAHEVKADCECPYDVGLNLDKVVRHATRIDSSVEFLERKHDIFDDPNPFFLSIVDDIQKASENFLAIHAQYKVQYAAVPFFNIDQLSSRICTVANRLQNFKVSLSLIEPISNHVSEVHLRKVATSVAKKFASALSAEQIEALQGEIEKEVNRIRAVKVAAKLKPSEEFIFDDDVNGDESDKITADEGTEDAKVINRGLKSLEATGLALAQVMAVAERLVEPADVYLELKRPVSQIAAQMKKIQKTLPSLAELFQCKTLPQPFFIGTVEDIGIICAEFLALQVELEGQLWTADDYKLEHSLTSSVPLIANVGADGDVVAPEEVEGEKSGTTIDTINSDISTLVINNANSNISKLTWNHPLSPTTITIIPEEEMENQLEKHPLADICIKFEEIKSSLQTFELNLEMTGPMIDLLTNAFVEQTTNEVVKSIAANMNKKRRQAEERQLRQMLQLEGTDLPDEVVFGGKTSDSMKNLLAGESESRTYFAMGVSYYEGYIEKDYARALHYLNGALEKGEKGAAFYLGEIYYNGLGLPKDYIKAFEYYQVSANNGDGESLSRVGYCLSVGHGTELSTEQAIRHYKLAYEKKSASGAYHYGHALFYGQTMEPNPKEGHDILYKASLKRIKRAKLDLALCYECGIEQNVSTEWAYTLVKDCYDVNVVGAWKVLARYTLHGVGTREDPEEAARICKKQSETAGIEMPDAQAYYGMCLVTGRGVRQDERKGMRLIRSGCVPNRCDGWHFLAECYRYGWGVERNVERALECYEKSSEGLWGMESKILSNLSLGEMYEAGEGVAVDIATAVRYYTYAADRYNSEAQNRLAGMYEEGVGVEKDMDRAFHYYFLASRTGLEVAQLKVQEFKDMGFGRIPAIENGEMDSSMAGARRLLGKLLRRRSNIQRRRNPRLWKPHQILLKLGWMGRGGGSNQSR